MADIELAKKAALLMLKVVCSYFDDEYANCENEELYAELPKEVADYILKEYGQLWNYEEAKAAGLLPC